MSAAADPVESVLDFLHQRFGMRGLDADYILGANHAILTVTALESIVGEVRRLRSAVTDVDRYARLTLDSISVERQGMAEDVLAIIARTTEAPQ